MASIQTGERKLGLEKTVENSEICFYLYVLCPVTTEEIKWAASLPPLPLDATIQALPNSHQQMEQFSVKIAVKCQRGSMRAILQELAHHNNPTNTYPWMS
jgi:hypothetical protein